MKSYQKVAAAAVQGIRQETQFSCMAASLSACLHALGKPYDESDVNRVLGAGPLRGARWEEMLAAIQYFGCRGTLMVPCTLEKVKSWTDSGFPVMIAWNPENRPWSHASVVFDVDEDWNVHIADPNIPDPTQTCRVVSRDDFHKAWGEPLGDMMIVRRPALAVELEVSSKGKHLTPKTASKMPKEKRQVLDALKTDRKIRREKAIQDGSYFQNPSKKHRDNSKYTRKQKHSPDYARMANDIATKIIGG